jgi:hypothetical protein
MKARFIALVAAIAAFMSLGLQGAAPQSAPATASAPPFTAEQLDQLVAPIALYPDPLVAQILMAATYPLEVVQADRWLQISTNAALTGDALTTTLQALLWDPSIKSLIPFPQVLHMMDNNLDWTEQLGDAFLAQQVDVMNAVQRLRQRAEASGSLASTPQQTVSEQEQEIIIEPASSETIYVPAYDPWCVYGVWPYPAYPPYYFGTWAGYCVPADAFLVFGFPIYPPFGFWAWGYFDWRHHYIRIDRDRFQRFHTRYEPPHDIWQHDPVHRRGVPYRDPATAARFLGAGAAAQRNFRGYAPVPITPQARPVAPSITRGVEQPSAAPVMRGIGPAASPFAAPTGSPHAVPPAFESFGQGARVQGEAARGFSSRTAPAPGVRAASPAFHAAPAFHGGSAPASPGGGGGHR